MKLLSRILMTAVAISGMAGMTSCRDELCYNHYPSADISLTWEHEWERDYGMNHISNWDAGLHGFSYSDLRPGKPERVRLVKYSSDGSSTVKFLEPDGGNVMVEANKSHSFLFYNSDTEYIVLSDMASLSNARASATARSRALAPYILSRHPEVRSTNPPDVLYAAFIEDAPEVAIHEKKPVPVKMQPLVYTYVIRYEFESGLDNVKLARGALGGMAESVYLRDGYTSEETTIILYDCDIKSYGCEAHVKSFGRPGFPDEYYGRSEAETPDRPYSLNLEVLLTNNTTLQFNYDITDQIERQPRGGVITVSGIVIEDDHVKIDAGFDVEISGWGNNIIQDLPLSGS